MAKITDPGVQELLAGPNYAVVSSHNADNTMHSTVVWIDYADGVLAVNSAVGRRWPANLDRDARVTLVVVECGNPNHFVEIEGSAQGRTDGAREHIDALARKYIGEDYPWLAPGEQRKTFVITPHHVRYVQQYLHHGRVSPT